MIIPASFVDFDKMPGDPEVDQFTTYLQERAHQDGLLIEVWQHCQSAGRSRSQRGDVLMAAATRTDSYEREGLRRSSEWSPATGVRRSHVLGDRSSLDSPARSKSASAKRAVRAV